MSLGKCTATFFFLSAVLLGQLLFSSLAQAQSGELSDNKAHLEITPYLFFGGVSGDLTIRGQRLPVDASPGDVLSHLQSGFMGRAAVSYNHWFVAADAKYVGLAGTSSICGPSLCIPVNVSVNEWNAEALGGYRVNRHVKVFGGSRYNNITSGFEFQGPLGTVRSRSGSYTWWDPFFGAQGELPLGRKFSASARFDIGGFGVGSQLAVNAEPLLNYKFNRLFLASLGWKFIYQDYKNTGTRFEYDLLEQGPFLGFTILF